jgi:hypothetical protein
MRRGDGSVQIPTVHHTPRAVHILPDEVRR